jgi:hypothetical protein
MKNTNIPRPPTEKELQEIVAFKLKLVYKNVTEDIAKFEENLYRNAYISIYDTYKTIKGEEYKLAIVTHKFKPTANEIYTWKNGNVEIYKER